METWKAEAFSEIAKEAILTEIKSKVREQLLHSIDGIIEDAVDGITKDISVNAKLERLCSKAGISDHLDVCIQNMIDKGE